MTTTRESIATLLKQSPYDPSIAPQLQSYVKLQAQSLLSPSSASSPYYFDCNRTLIKLYQFFPQLSDEGYISLILFLSLVEYPSTDVSALCCLVPEKIQNRDRGTSLNNLGELLSQCQFPAFWTAYDEASRSGGGPAAAADGGGSSSSTPPSTATDEASRLVNDMMTSPAVADKLRRAVWKVLALTYRSAPLDAVLGSLNLGSLAELKDFVGRDEEVERGVESMAEDGVVFVTSRDNTKRVRVFKEGVKFEKIAELVAGQ